VKKNGYALEYVPYALITEALCLVAVKEDGGALKFVPDNMKDAVKAAMEKKG